MNYLNLKMQNAKEIKRELWKFIGYFMVLVLVAFFSIFFFVLSYTRQYEHTKSKILSYNEVINKHHQLKGKLDTLYSLMSKMNTEQVSNNLFLSNMILNNVQDLRRAIGNDSVNFQHYYFLSAKLDSLMFVKSNISQVEVRRKMILDELEECKRQNGRLRQTLALDPSRGFGN